VSATLGEVEPITITEFEEVDRAGVIALWRACDLVRPWNDPSRDIDRKVDVGDSMFLIVRGNDSTLGTVMAGYEGHRGWINYLAVDPSRRGGGIGAALMNEAERRLSRLGCAKVNLQVRVDNERAAEFYRRLGYSIDPVVSMGKRLVDDT
jgi:ribosomal protein S18 acetylase RimI-like enzyme